MVATIPVGSNPIGVAITHASHVNAPPVLASNNASVTVNEGQTAANTGTVTDANHDTVILTASVGTVVNNGNGTWSWSFATTDGPTQSQTVTITGNDGHGGTGTTSFSLVVNNVAPTITSVTNNGPVVAGHAATLTVTATDPAGANDPLTYSFDCDNNGSFEIGPQAGNSAACTFATGGNHTVNVRVADGDGGVATGSTVVMVLADTDHDGIPDIHDNCPTVANPGPGGLRSRRHRRRLRSRHRQRRHSELQGPVRLHPRGYARRPAHRLLDRRALPVQRSVRHHSPLEQPRRVCRLCDRDRDAFPVGRLHLEPDPVADHFRRRSLELRQIAGPSH